LLDDVGRGGVAAQEALAGEHVLDHGIGAVLQGTDNGEELIGQTAGSQRAGAAGVGQEDAGGGPVTGPFGPELN